ncbi:unnamed protein product [Eretmochelys imbricata]
MLVLFVKLFMLCSEAGWPPKDPEWEGPHTEPWWAEPEPSCPSPRKWVGGAGSVKGGPESSVGRQPPETPDASCGLLNWEAAESAEGAEDWPGPLGLLADSDLEEADNWPGPPRLPWDLTLGGEDDWPRPPTDQTPKDLLAVSEAAVNLDPSLRQHFFISFCTTFSQSNM